MDWVLKSPQIHSTFGSLGFVSGDGYHVNENCNAALETILQNILVEDKYLRTYRRSISFGKNIDKDLIPLLLHAKDDKTIELLVKILVNLTIPIECILSVDIISRSEFGRHTIFEINNLLASTKSAFTDPRATKVIIEFLKKNFENEQDGTLTDEQCTNISNSLLLFRNILHIPEENDCMNSPIHTIQNQILWNIFGQNFDKILIKLMSIPEAFHWGVTMVQVIALLYKDQHVVNLHKLLNLWLETSSSDSSEDNESNTSPPDRGSDDSSPMLTSDPTSDSSDTGASGKCNDSPNSVNNGWDATSMNNTSENGQQPFQQPEKPAEEQQTSGGTEMDCSNEVNKSNKENAKPDEQVKNTKCTNMEVENPSKDNKKVNVSENSDCGYGTQIENQESISTSCNEDDMPFKKPVHQKPRNPKQRVNTKARTANISAQERKRKKTSKRAKSNIINLQGFSHKTPTDDDISNILKEFTVDFLLKGYNSLVHTLHSQILTNFQLEIDISHFFWLLTYFLKYATQIEVDFEQVSSVLSYDIITYLTAEGVNLCEQFELAIKLDGNDLKPNTKRLHLVVTAIREYVQAIEMYKKFKNDEDQEFLVMLQNKMCEMDELRNLMVLLLRHYNPKYQSKQYLRDLIVINHILLLFLDSVRKMSDYKGSMNMVDHIKQFATSEIMYQYGLLLEDYTSNGEFVNDCVFTMMHHVGGNLGGLDCLLQPGILRTITTMWRTEYEVCDDWTDLIEYVINTVIKKSASVNICPENGQIIVGPKIVDIESIKAEIGVETLEEPINTARSSYSEESWTEDELSSLSCNYMLVRAAADPVGELLRRLLDDGAAHSRDSLMRQLCKQNIISKREFDSASRTETETTTQTGDEIRKLSELLVQDGKGEYLDWVQKVLLETCFAKISLEKKNASQLPIQKEEKEKITNFEFFKTKIVEPVISPTSYHSLLYNRSVPLVPWNCAQAAICKDLRFLQLLHRLGFHMPVDTGKVFIRTPHFWTADFLYYTAGRIAPIDTKNLKFSVSDITMEPKKNSVKETYTLPELPKELETLLPPCEPVYQVIKQKHTATTMVNFMPMPGSSFSADGEVCQKHTWLQIVQKSQEHKLTLKFNTSPTITEDEEMVIDLAPLIASPPAPPPSPLGKTDASVCADSSEPEHCDISACEVVSVASDLTRMYVSDEEDTVWTRPRAAAARPRAPTPGDAPAEKRPRVQ